MVALFAGVILSGAFEPLGLWFLAPIAYLLFFALIKRSKRPIIDSFLFGVMSNLVVLQWSGKYVGLTPWILLSILQGLFYLPVGAIYRRYRSIALLVPAILALEELRARFPFGGFGWTRIAFSQADAPYISLVSFGGVLLVSALVLTISALFHTISRERVLAALVIIVAPLSLSHSDQFTNSLRVIGIQGNTPTVGIGFNDRAKAVFDLHVSETRKRVLDKYDLVVWPENAVDIDPIANRFVGRELSDLAREIDTPFIVGAVLSSRGSLENVSMLYEATGEVSSIYVKRHLTPFGEYMPLRPIAEFVSPYAKQVTDFSPAKIRVTHKVRGFTLGPIICYELIDDGLVRDMARNSNALIVQTNSATFAGTPEGSQQLDITRIRSIEHSRNTLSVSTVGISALIDNNGRVLSQSGENISASISGDLPMRSTTTIAGQLGGVAPLLVLSLTLFIALLISRRNRVL